jgi:hypothetical protein
MGQSQPSFVTITSLWAKEASFRGALIHDQQSQLLHKLGAEDRLPSSPVEPDQRRRVVGSPATGDLFPSGQVVV